MLRIDARDPTFHKRSKPCWVTRHSANPTYKSTISSDRHPMGQQIEMTIPGEKKGFFGKLFGGRVA